MLNNKVKSVFKYQLRGNMRITVWFLAIFAVIMILLGIMFTIMAAEGTSGMISTIAISFVSAGSIFLLVLGISTYSTFTSEFLFQGVSRKDYFKGMTLAAIVLVLLFSLIAIITILIEDFIHPLQTFPPFYENYPGALQFLPIWISSILAFYGCYVLGSMIGMTFYGYGVIKGLISVVFAIILYNITGNLMSSGFLDMGWGMSSFYVNNENVIGILASLAVSVGVTIINYFLNRNINIKISTS